MTLAGYLSEYSLAEIFNFIREGNRTGLLSVSPDPHTLIMPNDPYYLWFDSGRLVAITSGLDGKGLLKTIEQRNFVPSVHIESIGSEIHRLPQPLGLYFKSRGLLDAEQIKLLFNSQTLAPLCKVFELQDRSFRFDPQRLPMNGELTGLSLPVEEAGMMGLRFLKDWSGLSSKLPEPDYAIQRWSTQIPNFRLDRQELQLWKLADGEKPLTKLAVEMGISIDIVRRISFRLSTFRLVQEVPTEPITEISAELAVPILAPGYQNPQVSTSFLGNLKKFLKKGSEKSSRQLIK
jgi:hypothetical protein